MRQILHIRAEAALPAIETAIQRARARRLALSFPFGRTSAVADSELLTALAERCRSLGIDVAIIGGDETLRANAVAAGFAVATTPDEWDTGTMPTVRAARRGQRADDAERALPRLSLVIDDDAAAADPYDDEPPPYVIELMVSEGMYPNSHSDPPLGADGAQDEGSDALVASHEHYEEDMTAAIRDTGRLPRLPRSLAHEAG
jgi:hypothetical protein